MAEARDIRSLSLEELAETERLESELDAFITKRAEQAKDAEKVEELWAKSASEHREKRRQANGWGWLRHYEGLARAHRALALENDGKANHVRGLLRLPTREEREGEMNPNRNGHGAGEGRGVVR